MSELPSGTVTFLFTDLEGSTRLWEEHPDEMREALARHDTILREVVEGNSGQVVKTTGDGLHAVFATAHDAVYAATTAQLLLAREDWPLLVPLRVRMGLHAGESEIRDRDYYGTAVNRAARIAAAAHGGQTLVSQSTEQLVRDEPPEGVVFLDLGEHRLRDLGRPERLFQISGDANPTTFPPPRTLEAYPTNLPLQLNRFVGREREIDDIAAALSETPIVTLTGVGGVGKTRLALQAAAEVLPRFADGAWFADLAPVRDRAAVPDAVAAALGLQPEGGEPVTTRLGNFLRSKKLLLVVDNCEHVLDTAAELISSLSRASPGVRVLATSREGLALNGERIIAVGSLPVPASVVDLDAPAAQLFVERATAGGTVRLDDMEAIVHICRRLDGVPLALELAAARARSMSLTDLSERLDQRFRLLTGGRRDALSRHQTLRQAIDWSYDLLNPDEQTALDRFSVFAGGWDLRAAEAVVGGDDIDAFDVVDLLGHLVEKSLIVREDRDATGRYRLLETIRQYAQERLDGRGDTHTTRARHARYYADLLANSVFHLEGPDELEWTARLAWDTDNLRSALVWALDEPDVDTALRLVTNTSAPQGSAAVMFLPWAEAAIELPGAESHSLYPRALIYAAFAASLGGKTDRMAQLADEALAANTRLGNFDDARLHAVRGVAALQQGDMEQALLRLGTATQLAREDGNDYLLNIVLVAQSGIFGFLGDVEQSARDAEEATAAARRCGTTSGLAQALVNYGWILRDSEPARAFTALDEAAQLAARVGTPMALAFAYANMAILHARQGDHAGAGNGIRKAIAAARRRADRPQLGHVMIDTALTLLAAEATTPAAILAGAARSMLGAFFDISPDGKLLLTTLHEVLDERWVEELGAQGQTMDDDATIAFALAAVAATFEPVTDSPAS